MPGHVFFSNKITLEGEEITFVKVYSNALT